MEITNLHWECFRLGNQEKLPIFEVAEILGIETKEVKRLLKELRKAEPLLFPYEREYVEFGRQMNHHNYKLLQLADINKEEICQKF